MEAQALQESLGPRLISGTVYVYRFLTVCPQPLLQNPREYTIVPFVLDRGKPTTAPHNFTILILPQSPIISTSR